MIKIIEIKKTYPPFQMKNGGTLYGFGCTVEENGKQFYAKLVTFTPNIEIAAGKEYEPNKTENKSYTDNEGNEQKYIQYTIYAPKKQGYGKGFKQTYTLEEFEAVMDRAINYADKVIIKDFDKNIIFERYINNALMYGIKISSTKKEDDIPLKADNIDGDDPFFSEDEK